MAFPEFQASVETLANNILDLEARCNFAYQFERTWKKRRAPDDRRPWTTAIKEDYFGKIKLACYPGPDEVRFWKRLYPVLEYIRKHRIQSPTEEHWMPATAKGIMKVTIWKELDVFEMATILVVAARTKGAPLGEHPVTKDIKIMMDTFKDELPAEWAVKNKNPNDLDTSLPIVDEEHQEAAYIMRDRKRQRCTRSAITDVMHQYGLDGNRFENVLEDLCKTVDTKLAKCEETAMATDAVKTI
jgi:hypothetical protein